MKQKSQRNLSLDLLKVLSIMFIILLHYNNCQYGGGLCNVANGSINQLIISFIQSVAIIGPNLFVLISGYFLCKDDAIKTRKLVNIIIILVFYGISIFLLALLFKVISLNLSSLKDLAKSLINHWFIDIYIIMYLLHPFINKLTNSLTQKQNYYLIIIMLFFFSLWPSFLTKIMVNDNGYGIINFILLYLIASYVRNYYDKFKISNWYLLPYLIIVIITSILGIKYGRVLNYNFIGVIINSVIIFLFFKKIRISNFKIITSISSCSLSTLLIHSHFCTIQWMFQDLFKTPMFWNSSYMIIHAFISCLIILFVCVIIEQLRKLVFKYSVDKILDKIKLLNKVYIVD